MSDKQLVLLLQSTSYSVLLSTSKRRAEIGALEVLPFTTVCYINGLIWTLLICRKLHSQAKISRSNQLTGLVPADAKRARWLFFQSFFSRTYFVSVGLYMSISVLNCKTSYGILGAPKKFEKSSTGKGQIIVQKFVSSHLLQQMFHFVHA